jgi:hypothetical protein
MQWLVQLALRRPYTLVFGAEGPRVATVTADKKVKDRSVELGQDLGREVDNTRGLRVDEELIENPTDSLAEGTPVRSVPADAPPNPPGIDPARLTARSSPGHAAGVSRAAFSSWVSAVSARRSTGSCSYRPSSWSR